MATPPVSLFVKVDQVPWVERRPGVFWKVLWEDPEQIFVLEGSVADETGVCTAGNYARRPPGCVHTVVSQTGALVFALTSGSTEPV